MITKRFELTEKKLLDHARKSLDSDDVLDALRWANKADRLYGVTEDFSFQEIYADAYESAGILEGAIKHWFFALACASDDQLNEVYDALGACFDQQGDRRTSAYYYEKLLRRMKWKKEEIDSFLSELVDDTIPTKKKGSTPVPVAKADYSKEYFRGIDEMRSGEFSKARKTFRSIPKGSADYQKAINFITISSIMDGLKDEAVKSAEYAHSEFPDDVEILVTLSTAYKEVDRMDEAVEICNQLVQGKDYTNDEMFKICALCCELKLHNTAFEYAKDLEKLMPFDGNLLYMEGAAAINAGRYEEGISVLERLRTVYPEAAVVDYYLSYYKKGGTDQMSYIYRVPEQERKEREEFLASIYEIDKEDLPYFVEDHRSILNDLFRWCFDEMDGQDMHLQANAITLALYLEDMDFLSELLLNYETEDIVKTEIVRELCIKNKGAKLRLVCFNLYQEFELPKLKLGRKARKKFLEGYAICISQFGLRVDGMNELFPQKVEEMYCVLEEKNALDLAKSAEVVASALCFISAHREKEALRMLSRLLGADLDDVENLLEAYLG